MRYGMITNSMADIYTGVTVTVQDNDSDDDDSDAEFYCLEDGEFCHAIRGDCVRFISKTQFDFFAPRTKLILDFIEYNDQETSEQSESLNQFLVKKLEEL